MIVAGLVAHYAFNPLPPS